MKKLSEIDALKAVDEALTSLEDVEARNRVLTWAWEKFSSKSSPESAEKTKSKELPKAKGHRATKKSESKKKGKGKLSLSMVKELNLRPKGKKSFGQFVETMALKSNYQKCTAAVYYLKHELGIPAITANHVYTCFKDMRWRLPADLFNALQYSASVYGWLDTKVSQDIKLTTMGENLVEQDLPKKKDEKK